MIGRTIRGALLGAACALGLAGICPATAQVSTADKVAAETLFDQGLNLLRAGDLAAACPKFEQSEKIDPAIGTLLYLAECYERTGRTASAWATFREAASAASASGQAERARVGKQRAEKLVPLLSRVAFVVAAENSMPGFELRRDGKLVSSAVFGVAIPLDPGEHLISATAPGYESFEKTISVPERAERQTLTIPPLRRSQSAAVAAQPPAPSAPPSTAAPAAAPPESAAANGSGQRLWGAVLGGVGVVGLGVGIGFGIDARNQDEEAAKVCDGSRCSTHSGESASEAAQDSALIANLSYGVGAAALISGAILYFTAAETERAQPTDVALMPSFGPDGAALSWKGRF